MLGKGVGELPKGLLGTRAITIVVTIGLINREESVMPVKTKVCLLQTKSKPEPTI